MGDTVTPQQPLEESPGCLTISLGLKKDIDNFTVLINCPPQIELLTAYLHEYLINEKSIAVTPMFTFQASGVFGAELVAPEANRFVADGDSSLCE